MGGIIFLLTKEHDGSPFYSKKFALTIVKTLVQEFLEISFLLLHLKTQEMHIYMASS